MTYLYAGRHFSIPYRATGFSQRRIKHILKISPTVLVSGCIYISQIVAMVSNINRLYRRGSP